MNSAAQIPPLVFLAAVIDRGKGEKLAELFTEHGVKLSFLSLAKGTAEKSILSYLGLGETEKEVLYAAMPYVLSREMLKRLDCEFKLYKPGRGIAFTIPINSVVDAGSKKRLLGAVNVEGEKAMEQTYQHDVIVIIANQGYAEDVMDVARAAGATGGTILHARGVGLKHAEKFFGVTIQPEKEMLYIVAKKEASRKIMLAVTEQKGCHTDARAIAFSLPVNGVAGLFSVPPDCAAQEG